MSDELSRVLNWTHSVDKRVFQIQIDRMDDEMIQMKFSASTAKVKVQLERVNRYIVYMSCHIIITVRPRAVNNG